jgi:hypothetical protein
MSAVKEEIVSTASFLTRNVSDILSDPIHSNTSTSATHLTTVGAQSAVFGLVLNQGLLAYVRYGLLVVIGITEILGNALTIWAVLTTDRLRVKTYALTTSLAVTDFLNGFVHIGYVVHEAISSTACDMATYKRRCQTNGTT